MRPHTSSVIGTMGDNVSELTRAYWNEIGIRTNYKQLSEELWDLQAELLGTIGHGGEDGASDDHQQPDPQRAGGAAVLVRQLPVGAGRAGPVVHRGVALTGSLYSDAAPSRRRVRRSAGVMRLLLDPHCESYTESV